MEYTTPKLDFVARSLLFLAIGTSPASAMNPVPSPEHVREEFRVTGSTIGQLSTTTPAALASPYAEGYNPPTRSGSPSELVPYGGRIGLSRVPRGALSPLPPSSVQ